MKKRLNVGFTTAGIGLWAVLTACSPTQDAEQAGAPGNTAGGGAATMKAVAVLSPTEGNNAKGTVTFTKVADGIQVVAELSGLSPGEHGFHIHENGDCSAPDATSAGGHFNPTNAEHGAPNAEQRHAGDLGNITADQSGNARLERVDKHLSFQGTNSILNRAVIVHAGADDLSSQPSGNAGARLACGVIKPE